MYIFFRFFSIMAYYRILNIFPKLCSHILAIVNSAATNTGKTYHRQTLEVGEGFLKEIVTCFYSAVSGLSCGMQDLQLWHTNALLRHVGSSFLTKDRTRVPCTGSLKS